MGKKMKKTEKKTHKSVEERAGRESKSLSPDDDIEAILSNIQKEESKKNEVHVEDNVPAPSPRSNCSLCINPLKETELILYGGEFFNGNKTYVYGDLYRYDVDKNEWKLISSPNSPPPRSAHQAVAWKNYLYIYGGEFTSPNQVCFHHYKDFWMLDLKTNQWEEVNYKGCPSPRSGHRMVLYKDKIILFGGFYDTHREVRYHNDLHVFDLDKRKWQEIKPRPGCMWPSARSGFQFLVYQDEIYLYGGYSKEVSSDKNSSSEKGIVHSDIWSLDPRTWEWNEVKKSGMPPGPLASFSMCVHETRAVLFGGVVDLEGEDDVMISWFLNALYGFQFDNHRWYPLELRKEKSTKYKNKSYASDTDEKLSGGSLDTKASLIKAVNGATNDEEEKLNYDEPTGIDCNSEMSLDLEKNMSVDDCAVVAATSNGKVSELFAKVLKQNPAVQEIVKPCGRINSCMVVGRDTLYVYGGMMEVKDREITLNDLYALNLGELDEWKCLIAASESEWVKASEDEEDDEDEEDNSESDSDDMEDDDDDDNGVKDIIDYVLSESASGYALFHYREVVLGKRKRHQTFLNSIDDFDSFRNYAALEKFAPFQSASDARQQIAAVSRGEMTSGLGHFLLTTLPRARDEGRSTFVLGVADPILGKHISDMTGIRCESTAFVFEFLRGVRLHINSFIEHDDHVENKRLRRRSFEYSEDKIRDNMRVWLDRKIIQVSNHLDTVDKDINSLSMRLREWYSCHFPELGNLVADDNYLYANIVNFLGNKSFSEDKLQDLITLVGNKDKAKEIVKAAKASMGQDLSHIDFVIVNSTSQMVMDLTESRKKLYAHLVEDMNSRAPNLAALIGDVIGARLISAAGSLPNLAKISASDLQILGSEKSFRPKYGLICQSSLIGRASDCNKGRMARYLAKQCSLASQTDCHMDCFSKNYSCHVGIKLRQEAKKQLYSYEPSLKSSGEVIIKKRKNIAFKDGFVYRDLEKGDGKPALPGKMVTIEYSCRLKDGTKFTTDGKVVYSFCLGQVGDHWDIGTCGMHIGGRRKLTVPSALTMGYGSGARETIKAPRGEDVVFKIRLLDVV